ncbi:MAG: dephospho-CoA kinase [Chitinophagaceae bacterium]|nr:dephospho-CoA kinase [Rubrivivax sp.]
MRSIGLTGGIGSGKSTVAQTLRACGAHLVDTDAIARSLTGPGGAAMPALLAAFGPDLVAADGALDRQSMRAMVFSHAGARRRLEAVLHPMIGTEAARQAANAQGRVLLFDVPLLTESSHWRTRVDRVLVVDCSVATQVQRVARRPGWSAEAASSVIYQQAPRAARRAIADGVIFNDDIGLDQLAAQAIALWQAWVGARG